MSARVTYTELKRLDESVEPWDMESLGATLQSYLSTLSEVEQSNLMSLAEMYDRHALDAMADAAPDEDKQTFVRVAAIIRRVQDSLGMLANLKGEVETMESVAATFPEPEPYALPLVSVIEDDQQAIVVKMVKGAALKLTKINGWAVLSRKPGDTIYPTPQTVAAMFARGLLVPAIHQRWDGRANEYYLSAVGWRSQGILYCDQTAKVELRVYELAGTPADNPIAQKYRTITAEWRQRQAKKDTTPGWNRWSEFPVTISEKVTNNGVKTVVVLFESGQPFKQPNTWELFGDCLNERGHVQFATGEGAVLNKTVMEHATAVASGLARDFAEACRSSRKATKPVVPPKPPPPPLKVVEDNEDADEMARALGIL